LAGGVLALFILRTLKILERKLKQERSSRLRLKWTIGEYDAAAAMSALHDADLQISGFAVKQDAVARVEELRCSIVRLALREERGVPKALAEAVGRPGVLEWEWID
jgi:hypothetical protein